MKNHESLCVLYTFSLCHNTLKYYAHDLQLKLQEKGKVLFLSGSVLFPLELVAETKIMTEANFSVVESMAFLYLALVFIQELKLYLLIICHAERIADITSSVKQ